MFGYNTLGFGSIAGTAGPPDLDFTVVGSTATRGAGTFSRCCYRYSKHSSYGCYIKGRNSGSCSQFQQITIGGEAMTLL